MISPYNLCVYILVTDIFLYDIVSRAFAPSDDFVEFRLDLNALSLARSSGFDYPQVHVAVDAEVGPELLHRLETLGTRFHHFLSVKRVESRIYVVKGDKEMSGKDESHSRNPFGNRVMQWYWYPLSASVWYEYSPWRFPPFPYLHKFSPYTPKLMPVIANSLIPHTSHIFLKAHSITSMIRLFTSKPFAN